jgi:hypothetical protein
MKRSTTRTAHAAFSLLLALCAALSALLVSGCAENYYAEAYRAPEARHNTYYGPWYYPYYPWYSYYGGAYYYED